MKRNSSRICGRKDEHGADALPHAVEQQRLQPAHGQQRAGKIGHACEQIAEAVGERLAEREDDFEDADDDQQEQQRSPDAMQQHVVDLARVLGRKRRPVAGIAADLRGPAVRAGRVAHDGERKGLGLGAVAVLLIEEERHGVEAGAMDGADLRDRSAEFAGQLERVDLPAARLHQVGHVEQHQRGQSHRQHRRGEHQLAGQMKRVQNQKNSVGLGRAGHASAQHIHGDARVFRVRSERIDARQIDQREVFAAHAGHEAHALLDGDAGVVGDFLAQAGELVEERGFAGVGRADENDGLQRAFARRRRGRLKGRRLAAGVHRAASASSGSFVGRGRTACGGARATRMAAAVSWRRAISMPSMP